MAARLSLLLAGILRRPDISGSEFFSSWEILPARPVYNISDRAELEALAKQARACDIVFSQPLFNFGELNTENLRAKLGARLVLFSAPNFAAYFPDVLSFNYPAAEEKFKPPLEWHSKIFIQCKLANMSGSDLEGVYLGHPLFKRARVSEGIAKSLNIYAKRDQGVDIGSYHFVKDWHIKEPLFHTFNHPGDKLLSHLLSGMLARLGMSASRIAEVIERVPWGDGPNSWSEWGFGFNAWPIIKAWNSPWEFPGRHFFRVAGKELDILTAALLWNTYYDAHPHIFRLACEALNKG